MRVEAWPFSRILEDFSLAWLSSLFSNIHMYGFLIGLIIIPVRDIEETWPIVHAELDFFPQKEKLAKKINCSENPAIQGVSSLTTNRNKRIFGNFVVNLFFENFIADLDGKSRSVLKWRPLSLKNKKYNLLRV